MKCEFNDRDAFIERYLRKELSGEERELFEKHFFSCEECLNDLEAAQDMMELVRDEGETLFPEHSRQADSASDNQSGFVFLFNRILPPNWNLRPSLAYTFIAVLLVILGLYLLTPSFDDSNTRDDKITSRDDDTTPGPDEEQPGPDKKDSGSETDPDELYAANFVESDDLEYMIKQGVRDEGEVEIISPEAGSKTSGEILFKWIPDSGEKVQLKILNNREETLFKFSLRNNELLFNVVENDLGPGLYYWKLEGESNLLHVGKFLIETKSN